MDEAKDKKGETFDLSQWEDKALKNIPLQRNGSDCGVFACMVSGYHLTCRCGVFACR